MLQISQLISLFLCFRYNSITAVRENDLLGLEKLELLMLHSNMIVDIEDNTFQDLRSLQVKSFLSALDRPQPSTCWSLAHDYEHLLRTAQCTVEIINQL